MKLDKKATDRILNLCVLWGGHKEDTKLRLALNRLNLDTKDFVDVNGDVRVLLTLKSES